jgi:hypothetical protein
MLVTVVAGNVPLLSLLERQRPADGDVPAQTC